VGGGLISTLILHPLDLLKIRYISASFRQVHSITGSPCMTASRAAPGRPTPA
jgi:hypothetical protein